MATVTVWLLLVFTGPTGTGQVFSVDNIASREECEKLGASLKNSRIDSFSCLPVKKAAAR